MSKLPSQTPDYVTKLLDEAYARGVEMGKRIGFARSADMVRKMAYTADRANIINEIERLKNAPSV